jgi:hypothetical protein
VLGLATLSHGRDAYHRSRRRARHGSACDTDRR